MTRMNTNEEKKNLTTEVHGGENQKNNNSVKLRALRGLSSFFFFLWSFAIGFYGIMAEKTGP